MAYRLSPPNVQFSDQLGVPLAGGMLFFYVTGTNTPATTYADAGLTTPNANPIVLDSAGYANNVFFDPIQLYKVVLTDKNGLQQWSLDPVSDPSANAQSIATSLTISDASGATKSLFFATGTQDLWGLIANATPQTGSNVGADLVLNAYNDAGALLSNIFTVTRSTGVLNFTLAPTVGGAPLLPTGQIASFPTTAAPSGWHAADGSLVLRSSFAALTAFALASGNIVSDTTWVAGGFDGGFSTGDGSTTIRLPDYRGYFSRGWDNGRGVDTGRAIGTDQADQFQTHIHTATSGASFISYSGGGATNAASTGASNTSAPITGNFGAETRPKNLSGLFCIKT